MGLFDKFFKQANTEYNYVPTSEQEAWVGVIYACMSIDGEISDVEIDTFSRLLLFKEMFNGCEIVALYKSVAYSQQKIGNKSIIEKCVDKVPIANRPTLFCLVMEMVLCDGILDEKESEIVEFVSKTMQLDSELAQKIVEVILIKNKGNATF